MIRLSIQARQALAKLTLPVLIAASFGLMLLGKADTLLEERARMALSDALAPIYSAIAGPLAHVRDSVTGVTDLWDIQAENAQLRQQNDQLRRWQSIALALDAENRRLKAELHWIPDPAPSYVTARVVADAGGVYAKAVLLAVGPNHGIRKGEIALDERGLVGRVTEVGARSARVLLITDLNSRIPVILENSRAHAILVGTNGAQPKLMYWPEGIMPQEGERVEHQRRGRRVPGQPVRRHRALHQRECARGDPGMPCSTSWRWCTSSTTTRRASRGEFSASPSEFRPDGTTADARGLQIPGIRPRRTLGRQLDIILARQAFGGLHGVADAAGRDATGDRRSGGPVAGRDVDLRPFPAVPSLGHVAAGGVPAGGGARSPGLPAAGCRRADLAGGAWVRRAVALDPDPL